MWDNNNDVNGDGNDDDNNNNYDQHSKFVEKSIHTELGKNKHNNY